MFYTQQSFQEKLLKGIKKSKAVYEVDFVCKWLDKYHFCYVVSSFKGANVLKMLHTCHCVVHKEKFWDYYYNDLKDRYFKVFIFDISKDDEDKTKFEGTGWLSKKDYSLSFYTKRGGELLKNFHDYQNNHYYDDNKQYDIDLLKYILTNRNEIRKLYQKFK